MTPTPAYEIRFGLVSGLPITVALGECSGSQPIMLLCGTTRVALTEDEARKLADALGDALRESDRRDDLEHGLRAGRPQ